MSDPKHGGLPSVRTIRVSETRSGPSPEGPWGEPRQIAKVAGAPRDWELEEGVRTHRGITYTQRRVVPYVPESELERYRKLLQACLDANRSDANQCLFCDCYCWPESSYHRPHEDDCPLVTLGFLKKEGEVVR